MYLESSKMNYEKAKELKELYKSLDVANKNGKTIIIGHVDKSVNILPALLQEMYPYMKEAGYKFATPSMLYE